MFNKLCEIKTGGGAWFVEGITLKPGVPFLMTGKLFSNKRIQLLIADKVCVLYEEKKESVVKKEPVVEVQSEEKEFKRKKKFSSSDDKNKIEL